ncbi:MAG: hypothetical protein LW628_12800 [Fimbriimonadaceae bacterium]|nr:hypothetical protein [Fimbriimonadaceae bacterium]
MKTLRFTSTLGLLALCTVFAFGQGLGRGRSGGGGSGGSGGSSGGTTRPSTPPPPPSSPTPPPSRSAPPVLPPSAPPTTQDGGLGRGRSGGGGSTSGGSQGGGRDRGGSGGSSGGSTSGGRDSGGRDSGGRDGGLGRGGSGGSSSGGFGTGGSGSGGSRTDNGQGRDRTGSQGSTSGSTRDRGGSNDNSLGRARQDSQTGRSGRPQYGSTNNVTRDRSQRQFSVQAPSAGRGIIDISQTRASAQFGINGVIIGGNNLLINGWRNGYCHYNPNWIDNSFWFSNYCFNPWQVNVVISPFYWYPFVPGYINCQTVWVGNWASPWAWNLGNTYVFDSTWNSPWGGNWNQGFQNRDRDLDYSIEDLRVTFERQDLRAMDRLVPQDGRIAILRDGRYDYSINSQDFYDMLNDLSGSAQTRRYRIVEVRTFRNSARIQATHEYVDPWGNRQTVWHSLYLELERNGYVIREFGTSNRRIW